MSSSKVIYVNDDDMLGGMFNNDTKPVNTPETEITPTMTSTVHVKQFDDREESMTLQEVPMQPVTTTQQVPMAPQPQPALTQQPALVQPVITSSHQQPVMTGGNPEKEYTSDSESDDDDTEAEMQTDPSMQNTSIHENNDKDDNKDEDSSSDTSSICTEQLLTFDPMYIKLTKFLYTSDRNGQSGRNITQVLEGIEKQMKRLADALQKSALIQDAIVSDMASTSPDEN